MVGNRENALISEISSAYEIAVISKLGDREEQQDSFGFLTGENELFAVLCDGMGGIKGGRKASICAVKTAVEEFESAEPEEDPIPFMQMVTKLSDDRIVSLRDEEGNRLNGGSTMVMVLIRGRKLYWNSVGDSRIYLQRKKEFVQLTQDQNYRTVIDEQFRTGEISEKEYKEKQEGAEALINFLGIGNLRLIDYNQEPLLLKKNDSILLTSDGLYKLVGDDEIHEIVTNFSRCDEALQMLEYKMKKYAARKHALRDNTTVMLIRILK